MIKPNSFTPISLTLSAAAIVGAILGTVGTANADAVADFYKGRQIAIVHTGGPAGGFALYTRILAKHIVNHIPGKPTAVIQFKGGGGGMVGMNYLSVAAPKDGSYFLMPLPGVEAQPFLYPKKVKFDVTKINWIGNILKMQSFVSISASSKVKSWKDATKQVVTLGASGKGSETYIMPMLMNAVLGTKFKVITGYRGMGGIYLAMDRSEVKGFQSSWSALKILRPHWVEKDMVNVLAVNALSPLKDRPGIPLLKDIVTNPKDKQVAELLGGNMILGRGWLAPPDVPADRVAALRAAFKKSFEDPDAAAGAKKRKMTWEAAAWQDMQAAAERITKTDQAVIDRMQKALGLKK